jgi:hypothetical protein
MGASTTTTTAVRTFYDLARFEFILRDPADTGGPEIRVFWLYATQAAKILIPRLLPLGDQKAISNTLIQPPLIELPGDGLVDTVKLVDVSRFLVM